ncbi:putative phage assembly protein [Vibrio diabolicus]|nr:putative phage assembly protein [Vibrio diabolicus]
MVRFILVLMLISPLANAFESNLPGKTLNEFFIIASQTFHKTIVTDPSINGDLKIYQASGAANFRDVWFSVMRAHNLTYIESKTVIRVQPRNQLDASNLITTRTYRLEYMAADDLKDSLAQSLRVQASVLDVPDVTHVSSIIAGTALMVTAPQNMHPSIEEFIRYIDKPMRQIKVRAVIVETSRGNLSDLTVDWKAGAGAAAAGFMNGVPNLSSTSDDFTAFIRYIESNDNAEILSRPELTILHGQDGLISVGQELPFVTGSYTTESDSSDKPFQTIERKDVGLSLFVQPHIGANGNIKLRIRQELSRVDKSVEASDIVTSKRQIDTVLTVKLGDTVALGGMTSKETQNVEIKVPVLGDIPLLGLLFRSESEKVASRTLSVLLYVEEA